MAKLGVGVGDEFPANESPDIRTETVEVHHHYYRRRGPFRLFRVFLWIALISTFFRALGWLTHPFSYGFGRHDGGWGAWYGPEGPFGPATPFVQMGGTLVVMVVIGATLWFLRSRDPDRC